MEQDHKPSFSNLLGFAYDNIVESCLNSPLASTREYWEKKFKELQEKKEEDV